LPINTTTSSIDGFIGIDDKNDDAGDVGDVGDDDSGRGDGDGDDDDGGGRGDDDGGRGDDGDDDDESSGMTCRADTINLLSSTLTITPLPNCYEQCYDS